MDLIVVLCEVVDPGAVLEDVEGTSSVVVDSDVVVGASVVVTRVVVLSVVVGPYAMQRIVSNC